ncbi:MAG: UDP-N-acetylglucosamine--N-acetylmuramyl-(pentapeptide) pyrophosphoryl-undecaprenol N-acetylglucosamine transferase [bacterium]|nr:UDP-N-acetylglucosamine--N-acetylmuramyl-(pentapeptide) pyrophosphoryl-undecaprenol N-acetylglucosamine transferase [bacterium]
MRIVLTGGGTGGHFYPLIAVAEAIEDISKERVLIEPELYYFGPNAFDAEALHEHDITHVAIPAGRMRRYGSILNFFDIFKTLWGIIIATIRLFGIYPDIVFSTGGFASCPALVAARVLAIPVVIYDADAVPGRVSLWSSKFARWIAVAHPDAVSGFHESVRDRIARTGHPIRKEIEKPTGEGGHEFLKLDTAVPTIFIMGGSQGSVAINNVVSSALPELVKKYNIVHQAGLANLDEVSKVSKLILRDSFFDKRYKVFGLLNTLALRMTAGISSLVVSRAGSGSIFEIASWGIPAILIPIPEDVSHDQKENAYSYARSGAAIVLEQRNVTPHLFIAEIDRVISDPEMQKKMSAAALEFARPESARKIAAIIIDTALEHESA